MANIILGISAYYHDSAAVLLINGQIVAAAQEERFSRIKHDDRFPDGAVRFVLNEAGIKTEDVDLVIFYDKPFLKFERLVATYHGFAPFGIVSFLKAIPVWLKDKLFLKRAIRRELCKIGRLNAPVHFSDHHLSHAASAFFPSPFEEAAILTIDGVGEWSTLTVGKGTGNSIKVLKELHFPHSLGLLYSAFTYYLGFKVNSGEYKLMGLSPYGIRDSEEVRRFKENIKREMVDIRGDGSFLLNMAYFKFATGLQMTNDHLWEKLFGICRRLPEDDLLQGHADLALAIQQVTEDIVLRLASTARNLTGCINLVMAGGVALNCVANEKLANSKLFAGLWIQPAAGDAGGALGAALAAYYIGQKKIRIVDPGQSSMKNTYLGPSFADRQIQSALEKFDLAFEYIRSAELLAEKVAAQLEQGLIAGWFQGRMEFGPRALGNRSILADPRVPDMQKKLNLEIKFREGFRPFAPCVPEEEASVYFDMPFPSPFMLFTFPVKQARRHQIPAGFSSLSFQERLKFRRSDIPSVTHLDYSARVQTVNKKSNPLLHCLLYAFKERSGYPVLINTSFNVRGEPIVCTPEDAIRCFLSTGMDCLAIGNYFVSKKNQKEIYHSEVGHQTFRPD